MKVNENIKQIRLEKGLTQGSLADALHCDVASISRIENGKQDLKISQLEEISKFLRVEIIDLFTYPAKYVKQDSSNDNEKVLVTFEVSPKKRDELLNIVTNGK